MSDDRRGPAGDGFLALLHGLGPVLEIVKGVVATAESRIDWGSDNEIRQRERVEPLIEAYKVGKASYERLTAFGPEAMDRAARLMMVLKFDGVTAEPTVGNEVELLGAVLRNLTSHSSVTVSPREDAHARGTVDGV